MYFKFKLKIIRGKLAEIVGQPRTSPESPQPQPQPSSPSHKQTMATLTSLPKEISDKIWHTVLSPTGYAILLPNPDAHGRWDHLNYYDLFAITISDISPTTFT